MIDRIFGEHPRSVGESYAEHFIVAGSFGLALIAGGLKALAHAVLPNLFETAGSDTVRRLHAIMVEKRGAKRAATGEMLSVDWVI